MQTPYYQKKKKSVLYLGNEYIALHARKDQAANMSGLCISVELVFLQWNDINMKESRNHLFGPS